MKINFRKMLKLAILFTCIVVIIEAQQQRQNFYLPYLFNQQQLDQSEQYFIRTRPSIRPFGRLPLLSGSSGLPDYYSPYFRLPGQLNRQQYRPPVYYLVPINSFRRQEPSNVDKLFPSPSQNPSAVPEDEGECQHDQQEDSPVQAVETTN